jgi:hypothetical protein
VVHFYVSLPHHLLFLIYNLVTTLAGGVHGCADGIGSQARFCMPSGIVYYAKGDFFFVTDGYNNKIRKITTNGMEGEKKDAVE